MKKLKEKLSAKLSKNGGFTLIEMLIVVAIIAILVAVSIPLVNGALDKARQATDDANLRAAQAVGMVTYLNATADGAEDSADGTYWYLIGDNKNGTLSTKGASAPSEAYGKTSANSERAIKVTIDHDSTDATKIVVAEWADIS